MYKIGEIAPKCSTKESLPNVRNTDRHRELDHNDSRESRVGKKGEREYDRRDLNDCRANRTPRVGSRPFEWNN